ncbi:histidine phosphatase superfamily [Halenospora varia]|nr:histidine phosphatase superfamily [Halenospora varia]
MSSSTPIARGGKKYKYERLLDTEPAPEATRTLDVHEATHRILDHHLKTFRSIKRRQLILMASTVIGALVLLYWVIGSNSYDLLSNCDSVDVGYQCQPEISHYWGQYSPYFSVPSEISSEVPDGCQITFAQILSRHAARDPTSGKTKSYNSTINRIHANAKSYTGDYAFIKDYQYTLGADQLTSFGQQQMINSGEKFYSRYRTLALHTIPFIRSSGQDRVVESALNWTQGYHSSRAQDNPANANEGYPYPMVIISEDAGFNNSLSHSLCTEFEDGAFSDHGDDAQAAWAAVFTPAITARLNENLPGVNFTMDETIYMMDMCPFNTVADSAGAISAFCALFTESEWNAYDYYQSLGKYYGYGWGNPLGATQGVGFANELIARLTNTPVNDHTSTNSTLDSSRKTFPLGGSTSLYADFSHDNDMTSIFMALGLYNRTRPLLNTTIEDVQDTNGYSAAWTVPFAARAYFEKMVCLDDDEEMVRVIVNDRVLPLEACQAGKLGQCSVSAFVDMLSFPRDGGNWDKCFV